MMHIYDSLRAVFDCFLASNDGGVAKISTPTNCGSDFPVFKLILFLSIHLLLYIKTYWGAATGKQERQSKLGSCMLR